jgi:TonB family protein
MAHDFMFGPDPATPAGPAADGGFESGAGLPAARAGGESDLAELAAKFAAHVSPEIAADLALEIVLNEVAEQGCSATGASGAAIVLKRGGEWICRASAGSSAPQLGARLDTEGGLSRACMKTRKLQRCDDAAADPRADMEACRRLGVRSVIILPLLRNDGLAGLFELFSSSPSAFGARDERTLEALSQRVLKNLERASEALSAGMEAARAAQFAAENKDATSDSDYGSVGRPVLRPGSEPGFGRGITFITWALGAAVLGFAVLLTVRVGQHLGRGQAAARAHPQAAIPAAFSGAENRSEAASGGAAEGAASAVSGNQSEANRVSGTPLSGPASAAATSATGHPTDLSPAGSLLVYENGKEVFRIPPTAEQAEDSLLHRVEPDYPEEARQQQIQGPVVLDVRAGRDGAIEEVKLISGQRLLADAAIAAVKQWRFRPRMVQGQPVEMETKITLNFKLPQ